MSAAATTSTPAVARAAAEPIRVYRDDGPLARAVGRVPASRVPAAPLLLLAAAAPLLAVAALEGGDASRPVAAAVLAWAIVAGGASLARPGRPKTRWAEPALLRTIEFVGLIWIAALEAPSAYPAAFAVLAVLTFRHYDLAYRPRQRGTTPAPWVSALAGGWDGRLVAAFVLLLAGALPAGFYVAAAALAAAFAFEAVATWRGGDGQAAALDDDDEEGV
jgi:hypothetical protein